MVRILQVGLGPLGRIIVADAAKRGMAEVVAAVDPAPQIAGVPLKSVVPECPWGADVLASLEAVTVWPQVQCAVVSTSSDLSKCAPTLRALLARGVSVVSTCEELLYPWLRHADLAQELDALAKRHNARLLGTGVNPGFLMDALPVAMTAVCRDVRSVRCWRIQDASTRRIPFQKKIGAGLDDQQFAAKVKEGTLRHVGLGESIHFIAHYLGWTIAKWDESIEPVKADRDLMCGLGAITKGRASGVRQVARAWPTADTSKSPLIQMEFQAAIGQADPHDRIALDSDPPIDLRIPGAVHGDAATSAITLNAIVSLLAAPAGLHTMATVPMVRFTPGSRA